MGVQMCNRCALVSSVDADLKQHSPLSPQGPVETTSSGQVHCKVYNQPKPVSRSERERTSKVSQLRHARLLDGSMQWGVEAGGVTAHEPVTLALACSFKVEPVCNSLFAITGS